METGNNVLEVLGSGVAEVVGNPGALMDVLGAAGIKFNIVDAPEKNKVHIGMPLLQAIGNRAEIIGNPDSDLIKGLSNSVVIEVERSIRNSEPARAARDKNTPPKNKM